LQSLVDEGVIFDQGVMPTTEPVDSLDAIRIGLIHGVIEKGD